MLASYHAVPLLFYFRPPVANTGRYEVSAGGFGCRREEEDQAPHRSGELTLKTTRRMLPYPPYIISTNLNSYFLARLHQLPRVGDKENELRLVPATKKPREFDPCCAVAATSMSDPSD